MNEDIEACARKTIQRTADLNCDKTDFSTWNAADRDAYRTAVALLTLPPLMTDDSVRALVGELPGFDELGYSDLAGSANADRHEGREWLPRYKLALALLAQTVGILDGVCSRIASALADNKPAGASIAKLRTEANALWLAHLRVVGDHTKELT